MNLREHSWEFVVAALSWIVAIVALVCLGAFAAADAGKRRRASRPARPARTLSRRAVPVLVEMRS